MPETRRLLEAASSLSQILRASGIPHAFHGSIFTAVLAASPQADVRIHIRLTPIDDALLTLMQEVYCIVEGGNTHPFRRVRQAVAGNQDISMTASPWSNRYVGNPTFPRVNEAEASSSAYTQNTSVASPR